MKEFTHISVLKNQAIEALAIQSNGVYVDATVGLGGYTEDIASKLDKGRVIGLDADSDALALAQERLQVYADKVLLRQANFRLLDRILAELDISSVNGIVADLGVSSMELEDDKRGFSFRSDALLDMRFDQNTQSLTAADIVNTYSQDDLVQIFKNFGDEPFSGRIARVICEARRISKITTTQELVDIIMNIVPAKGKSHRIHPATRVFQALRMEVNDEIGALNSLLENSLQVLQSQGRLVIVSFHSGEDRIVKHTFKNWHQQGLAEILTKKPITPDFEEIAHNPRARSAKMRIITKH